jgi:hypothetical protein
LFVEALLPLLLSPISKDVGLTGLSKYYAWYQVLTGSYNFANLLKHKFWSSEQNLTKHKAFIEFLSERARDIYRDILVQQSWLGGEDKKDKLLIDLSAYPRYQDWWLGYCESYLDFPLRFDFSQLFADWTRPVGEALDPHGPSIQLWQTYKESALPLLSYDFTNIKGEKKKKKINLNFLNLPLVAAALSDYRELVSETLSPLLKALPEGASESHIAAPMIYVFTARNGQVTGSFIPRADRPSVNKVFALLTEAEYRKTLTKDYRHDGSQTTISSEVWNWSAPLRGAFVPPDSIDNTFRRLEDLLSIQKLYDMMEPVTILKKTLSEKPNPRVGFPVIINKMLSTLKNVELRKHLFLLQEKIVPSLRAF